MKRIIVTENQFKTVMGNLINELSGPAPKSKEFARNINKSFSSGQYKINNYNEIDTVLGEFQNYAKPGTGKYTIEIESSESKVPNESAGFKPGELSRNRATEVKNYIDSKKLTQFTTKINDKGPQGPEWNKKLTKDYTGYTQYQYVKLILKGNNPESGTNECLVDLKIVVDYLGYEGVKYPNHNCDLALFKLFANGIPVKSETGDDFVNLNNSNPNTTGPGFKRVITLKIGGQDAKNILSKNKEKIDFNLQCWTDDEVGCHSEPIHIVVYDKNNKMLTKDINVFASVGRLKYGQSIKLMTTDSCGNVTYIKTATDKEINEPDQAFNDMVTAKRKAKERFGMKAGGNSKSGYENQSVATVYSYVNQNNVISFPPNSFPYMDNVKRFNNRPWTEFAEYFEIDSKQMKEIIPLGRTIAMQRNSSSSSSLATK